MVSGKLEIFCLSIPSERAPPKLSDFNLDHNFILSLLLQTASVLDVKTAYHRCEHSVPPYQQRLVFERTELDDDKRLCNYPEIENGATIFLIRLIPFQLFVKGMDGSSHTISIPTKTPEVCGWDVWGVCVWGGCMDVWGCLAGISSLQTAVMVASPQFSCTIHP